MPDSPAQEMDTSVTAWIAAFNKAKGWKTLKGSSANRPDAENLRTSPKRQLREDGEKALAGMTKDELTAEISFDEGRLAEVKAEIATPTAESDVAALKEEQDELAAKVAEAKANMAIATRVEQRIAQLQAAEGNVRGDLADVRNELTALRSAEKTFDLNHEDNQEDIAAFRARHIGMQKNIERARAEVVKITTEGGTKSRSYAVINAKEYKLLYAMLEKSILILETAGPAAALAQIDATEDQLVTFRNARTGATAIAQVASGFGDMDAPMEALLSAIESLNSNGFDAAADQFRFDYEVVAITVEKAVNAGKADIRKTFLPVVEKFSGRVNDAIATGAKIDALWSQMETDIASLRQNGHVHRPARSERELNASRAFCAEQTVMANGLAQAEEAGAIIRKRLDRATRQDLRKVNLKPAELSKQTVELEGQFEALFKHNKKGERKTQKDRLSQEDKGVKKNSDLPRGALEEVELRLAAAHQLIASDSVDALATADTYLEGVKNFLDQITKDPKVYVDLGKGFDSVAKQLAEIKKKLPKYSPGRQLELAGELKALRDDHLTRVPSEVADSTRDLSETITKFREELLEHQVLKRRLANRADDVDKTIQKIGKTLKSITKPEDSPFKTLKDYYGPEVGKMETVRNNIAERTVSSLANAQKDLIDMTAGLNLFLMLLEKHKKGETWSDGESQLVSGFVTDAITGQTNHDANQAQKKPFGKAVDAVNKVIKEAEKVLAKLKGDPIEMERLKADLTGLEAETKNAGSYIDGLEKLTGIESRANQILKEAKEAAEVVDLKLPDMAKRCSASIKAFATGLGTFVNDVIVPAGVEDGGNQLDGDPFDAAAINAFFTKLAASVDGLDMVGMNANAQIVANSRETVPARKLARKAALQEVRKSMAMFDSFPPMQHFRTHPFAKSDSAAHLVSARKALPNLELRLLTAIKD